MYIPVMNPIRVPIIVLAVAKAFELFMNDTIKNTIDVLASVERTIIPSILSRTGNATKEPPPDMIYISAKGRQS